MKCFNIAMIAAIGFGLAGKAEAAPRTMISDFVGLECNVNSNGAVLWTQPSLDSSSLDTLDDGSAVKIIGGRQFGRFVAFPNTDEEFARTWLQVVVIDDAGFLSKLGGWVQSGNINCGG